MWHRFPETQPPKDGWYQCTMEIRSEHRRYVRNLFWHNNRQIFVEYGGRDEYKYGDEISNCIFGRVIAWKEMCKPYMKDFIKKECFTETKIFKKEYGYMSYENDYSRPLIEKELNGDKVMLYKACGIPKDLITYSTEFVNKTKKTYLNVSGEYKIQELGFENYLNVHILIDTDIYDGYEVQVNDGLVIVILHEIKNEAPVLKDYGVSESEDNEAHFPID
jgi:hypothetical protein